MQLIYYRLQLACTESALFIIYMYYIIIQLYSGTTHMVVVECSVKSFMQLWSRITHDRVLNEEFYVDCIYSDN